MSTPLLPLHRTRDGGRGRRARLRSSLLLSGGAALLVLVLTLVPRRVIAPGQTAVVHGAALLLGGWTTAEVETLLNVLMFVPLGAALAALLRRAWPLAAPLGLALSLSVETLQTRVPGRVPDLDDVLWNTAGAAVGMIVWVVGRGIRLSLARGSRRAGRGRRVQRR